MDEEVGSVTQSTPEISQATLKEHKDEEPKTNEASEFNNPEQAEKSNPLINHMQIR